MTEAPLTGRRVLVVAHRYDYDPGVLGERLGELGARLQLMPREEPARWPAVGAHDLVLSLGSVWMAEDPELAEPVRAERAYLRGAVDAGVPVLGVCFGAQQLAAACGGAVLPSPAPEVGWYEVGTTDPALVAAGPWMQFHYDTIEAPADAEVVATNDVCVQAFTLANAVGVQFHPEVTVATVHRWLAEGGDHHLDRLGHDRAALVGDTERFAPVARRRSHALVDEWLRRSGRLRLTP